MPDSRDFALLIAELGKDMLHLETLTRENGRAWNRIVQGADDSLDYAALGYTIHNIYCLIENYFLRITKFFENNLDRETWHKDLVQRMTLTISAVRPAFMGEELASDIDEIRAFRYVFRNLYLSPIHPERVLAVQSKIPDIVVRFKDAHDKYVAVLHDIAAKVGEP